MESNLILVLDFGGPQARAMAHKLRSQNYYCEIHPCSMPPEDVVALSPKGIVLAGGPGERAFDEGILHLGMPILAMGAASRAMAKLLKGQCEGVQLSERASKITFLRCPLFEGLSESDRYFTRVDTLRLPDTLVPVATTIDGLIPAFADLKNRIYGLQFYAESNDPDGARILGNFASNVCGCAASWTAENFIQAQIEHIRSRVGDGAALAAISGGADSTVCAVLMHKALGARAHCVFVDTGLLRKGEAELVAQNFRETLELPLTIVDAKARMFESLKGISDPIEKRDIVARVLADVLREEAALHPEAAFIAEGTIYPDVLDDAAQPPSPIDGLTRIEPLKMLFKDEVRTAGTMLGLDKRLLNRQPFPLPGLAVRCIGEVTPQKLAMLREADAIFTAEVLEAGLDRRLERYFTVLTNTRTVCQRDGHVDYEYVCALCAIPDGGSGLAKLPYDLVERTALRITNQVPGLGRIVYDVTGRPGASVEWE